MPRRCRRSRSSGLQTALGVAAGEIEQPAGGDRQLPTDAVAIARRDRRRVPGRLVRREERLLIRAAVEVEQGSGDRRETQPRDAGCVVPHARALVVVRPSGGAQPDMDLGVRIGQDPDAVGAQCRRAGERAAVLRGRDDATIDPRQRVHADADAVDGPGAGRFSELRARASELLQLDAAGDAVEKRKELVRLGHPQSVPNDRHRERRMPRLWMSAPEAVIVQNRWCPRHPLRCQSGARDYHPDPGTRLTGVIRTDKCQGRGPSRLGQ